MYSRKMQSEMPLRMLRSHLLSLLPLLTPIERGRDRATAVRGQWGSSWVSTRVSWGSWQDNLAGGEVSTPCMSVLFSFERPKGVVCLFLYSLPQKGATYWHANSAFPNLCSIWSVQGLSFKIDLLNLDRACSLFSDSRSSNYLLKTSQSEMRP